MSRITDLVDQAGSTDEVTPARAPRAVVGTDAADADAVWQALAAGAELDIASDAGPGGLTRVYVPVAAEGFMEQVNAEPERVAPGTRLGSYRAHPLYVPDLPGGRVLLHALRLLEEDALSDLDDAARDALTAAALVHALGEEARGTPFDERVSMHAVDAFLALGASAEVSSTALPAVPSSAATRALEALLILDAAKGAVATARSGLPLVLLRAGRPALLAAVAGDHSGSAALLVKLVVATLDLGQGLGRTLAQLGDQRAALAMMLDERGAFQAGSSPANALHVRGYERDEAS
ncbi:MAG: hypothetical protein KC593_04120 [Myxococcales bacterium]|nr:hypothetical protein [Myxococcales bacterium]MCB9629954.1 hypothetical protein [Sandaracinaceae bacterium]